MAVERASPVIASQNCASNESLCAMSGSLTQVTLLLPSVTVALFPGYTSRGPSIKRASSVTILSDKDEVEKTLRVGWDFVTKGVAEDREMAEALGEN